MRTLRRAQDAVCAILRHGPSYFVLMRDGLLRWMESREFKRLDDIRGRLSLRESPDPSAFERANYIRTLSDWGQLFAYQAHLRRFRDEKPA